MDTDFPGSGEIKGTKDGALLHKSLFTYTPSDPGYELKFWTLESPSEGWTFVNNPMNTGGLDDFKEYYGRAMVTAQITFHGLAADGGELLQNVPPPRYEDTVLMDADKVFKYYYPHVLTHTLVDQNPYDSKDKERLRKYCPQPFFCP